MSVKPVGIQDHNGTGWKIHPCCHRGCGENGIQAAFGHQLLKDQLPDGKVPAVMGSHGIVLQECHVPMVGNMISFLGELFDPQIQFFLSLRRQYFIVFA